MKSIHTLKMNSNAILVGFTLLLAGACTTPDSAWTLGGRTLPAPAAASDILRESIANTPQPNAVEHIRTTSLTTKEEWVQSIRALDASNMQRGEALPERRSVTIRKTEIAGVTVRIVTAASTLRFKELRLETPGVLWAGTPWADLTKTGDSQFTNEGIDRMLVTYDGLLEGAAKLYADGRDLKTEFGPPLL